MKKTFEFLFLFLFFFSVFPFCAAAEGDEEAKINSEYSDFFENLPGSVSESLPEGVTGEDSLSDAEALFSWDNIFDVISDALSIQFRHVVPVFCSLCGILLAAAAVNAMRSALSPKFGDVLSLCTCCAVCGASLLLQYETLSGCARYLSDLSALVNALLPLTVSLYAAGGNLSAASVSAGGFGVFLNLCENFLAKTVMPFCGVCLAFALCSGISQRFNLRALSGSIKKTYTTALGFITTLFCAVLAAQSAIASGKDSLSMRAAKFVAGSAIPMLGGTVSESLRTLSTSVGILRKSIGSVGIALIFLLFLPTLLSLLLMRSANSLASGFASLLGCDRESALLAEISSVYGYICGVLCVCSVSFIFILTLLVGAGTAGFNT